MPIDNNLFLGAFLGRHSPQTFLDHYWQKKPLLIRQAFPEWIDCLSPEELAGLALEPHIESRLITTPHNANQSWRLEHGPFTSADFNRPETPPWTLLVQAIDHHLGEFAALLDQFNFIPQWRLDDLMMSYAVAGGSVGPHYDYYDVFLIQTSGQRTWRIGQMCDEQSPLLPDLPIRILAEFKEQQCWTLVPGDVLYLPPGLAHYGIAEDDHCMTLSVGFRAPDYCELLAEYSHHLAAEQQGQGQAKRYEDPGLKACIDDDPPGNDNNYSGRLANAAVEQIQQHWQALLADTTSLKDWLAMQLSLPKYDDSELQPAVLSMNEMLTRLQQQPILQRDEASRFIMSESASLMINGRYFLQTAAIASLAQLICGRRRIPCKAILTHINSLSDDMQRTAKIWLLDLINQGYLYFPKDADD